MSELIVPVFNFAESASTSNSTPSGTYSTLLTMASLTTKGFPVEICMVEGSLYASRAAAGSLEAHFRIMRDAVQIAEFKLRGDDLKEIWTPATLRKLELNLAPGSYVYKLEAKIVSGTTAGIDDLKMLVREIERTVI